MGPFFFSSDALIYRVEKGFKNGPFEKNLEGVRFLDIEVNLLG